MSARKAPPCCDAAPAAGASASATSSAIVRMNVDAFRVTAEDCSLASAESSTREAATFAADFANPPRRVTVTPVTRRSGWLATLLVLAATLAGTASASTPYSVLDLGPSAHLAQGINDRGNVVGEADPALAFVFD